MFNLGEFCSPCRDVEQVNHSASYLYKNRNLWEGVCKRLYVAGYQEEQQTANNSSSSDQVLPRSTSRGQPLRFNPAPSNAKMECERTATFYNKRGACLEKKRQIALKAIQANSNDPTIERAILQSILLHADNEKENKPVASLLSTSRGGKLKTATFERKKTNTSIVKGLGVMLGRISKIAPKTYAKELLSGS
jgi:hypothetical protein